MTGLEVVAAGAAAGLFIAAVGVIAPEPPGYVPLRCGDMNFQCWDNYIARVRARQEYEAERARADELKQKQLIFAKAKAPDGSVGSSTVKVGSNVKAGGNVQVDGQTTTSTPGRQPGDRMKESSTGHDALDQLQGVDRAQRRARQTGAGDARIQSTRKSEQNVDNRNKRIKSAADAKDAYPDDDITD